MLDIGFATSDEMSSELGARLKAQRLAQGIAQADLAGRAGVSVGTIKNLESKGQCSLETLVRIAMALGLADHLQALFALKVQTIAQMAQAQRAKRQRAPRRVLP
jgi:transcriptional regulator with XRE-family HTH domain